MVGMIILIKYIYRDRCIYKVEKKVTPCHRCHSDIHIHLFAQQLYNFSEKLYNCFFKLEEESGFSQVFEDECYLTGREDALGTSVPRLRQGLR